MKRNEYLRQLLFIQTIKDLALFESHAYKNIEDKRILLEISQFLIDKLVKHEKFGELVGISLYDEKEPELSIKEESNPSGLAI